jgi:hypothetical protein
MKMGVSAQNPGPFAAFGSAVEVDHLTAPVNSRIRPTRTEHIDRVVGHPAQCGLDALLNRGRLALALALPAMEWRAIVLNPGGQPHDRSAHQRPSSNS